MRIILFHQYFLGKNDSGGSRWNEFTKFFSKKDNISMDVIAGNIHYATGKQIWKNVWSNKEEIDEHITLYRTWTYSGYNKNFFGRLIGYFSYMFSSLIKSFLLKKPDIIIITSPSIFVGISAMILSKLKRVPFIVEVRDLWPESASATGVLKSKFLLNILYALEYRLYKNSEKIVVLTPAFKSNIIKRFPEFAEKLVVITNGADFSIMNGSDNADKIRKKYHWGGKKVFAYFGAHGVANDLMQIVEVANDMIDNHKLLFVLIGDGMQKNMLRGKAKEWGLSNVQFIDSVSKSEVADYINAIDIGMATLKKTETFKTVYPNKVFDYMSCKKPVLVTIDGITRELVEAAECGLYSEPENMVDFRDAVNRFLEMSDDKLTQFGENGFEFAKEHFDRKKLSQKYINTIKEVVYVRR